MKIISSLKELNIDKNSRVLVFMPHPDDEAVFCSGLIKKLTSNQIKIRGVTMTSGEKSTLVFGLKTGDDLATVRRAEQTNSYKILGINNFEILDFPDGGLKLHEKEAKEYIKKQIKEFYPTHIITLEPDGIYGHPDHIALSKFVSDIVSSPVKLLYVTIPPFKEKRPVSKMSEKPVINPIIPEFCLELKNTEKKAKIASLRAHRSQFDTFSSDSQSFKFFQATKLLNNEYFTYR